MSDILEILKTQQKQISSLTEIVKVLSDRLEAVENPKDLAIATRNFFKYAGTKSSEQGK